MEKMTFAPTFLLAQNYVFVVCTYKKGNANFCLYVYKIVGSVNNLVTFIKLVQYIELNQYQFLYFIGINSGIKCNDEGRI